MHHLYIHVPFCTRRCSYCDFAIAVRRTVPSRGFCDAILREWGIRSVGPSGERAALRTIYFGGGTPSKLAPSTLHDLLAALLREDSVDCGAEITLEANPEDVTAASAEAWVRAGINRVSLGVQAFSDTTLQWMHRTHSTEDVGKAVARLRSAGVGNLSLDLIFGLPDRIERNWQFELERALALEPDHLSLYGLTVEEHTPLGKWVTRGDVDVPPEARAADEYIQAHDLLRVEGWHHYEVSNFCRPGFESQHNQAYWRRDSYLGLGPSAHSAEGNRRQWNLRHWEAYRVAISEEGSAMEGEERLTTDQVKLEQLYLDLRTSRGIAEAELAPILVDRWVEAGWAERTDGRVRLSARGWLRLDALVGTIRDF